MKVTGKTRIFKNEYNGNTYYTTSISNKKEDGSYENMYISTQFKKGKEVEGVIEITDSFLTFYKDKNGLPKVKLVILDYATNQEFDFTTVNTEEELPF